MSTLSAQWLEYSLALLVLEESYLLCTERESDMQPRIGRLFWNDCAYRRKSEQVGSLCREEDVKMAGTYPPLRTRNTYRYGCSSKAKVNL
jgi:hypothetical protein